MADVFLSYSRQDKARAEQFVHLLEGQGWDVFWDQETRAGTLWPKVLEDELTQARCLLVLWTANSVASRWVRIEAYEALQNDKLLPVRLERVKPPMEFRQTQAFDLIGWNGDREDPRLQNLIADLCVFAKLAPRNPVERPQSVTVSALAPASGEWLATPTIAGTTDFTAHRAPTYRSVPGVAAPTSAPGIDETPKPDAPPDDERPRTAAAGTAVAGASRRKLWVGLGLGAAAIVAVWIVQTLIVPGEKTAAEPFTPEVLTKQPERPPTAVAADPGPKDSAPVVTAPINASGMAVAKPTAAAAKPARTLPARCIEITEKFQTTGQLTAEERQFLASKECAK
jgi:hypothetical protein